jgi:hypothetical protein
MDLSEQLKKFLNGWTQATKEQFTGHPIATLFRQDIKGEIDAIVKNSDPLFEVKASVGAGNWANVPWLSILNPKITSTTQDGIYPVYLFNADGSGFYLSLIQGTTNPTKLLGKRTAEKRAKKIKDFLLFNIPELSEWGQPDIDLRAGTSLGKSYEKTNISAKYYDASAIPLSEDLIEDLKSILNIYKKIEQIDIETMLNINESINPTTTLGQLPENLILLSKPFLLLAGISGTGKTRFVREQAKLAGAFNDTYCLTSVRPDWHEPSDLLGYISRLNGQAEYVTTDVLQFIAKAWRGIADAGLSIETRLVDKQGERLVVSGERDALENIKPYWLCLDEMNLAPVEQYFADYLSVLETREWHWEGDDFIYCSDALLKPATIDELDDKSKHELRKALGFENANYEELWQLICQYGLAIPFNLIVAGTVNMDETTHGFSRKVIDRALSFDFGEFFPNDYDEFFAPNSRHKSLSYPILSHATQTDLDSTFDKLGEQSITFLKAVNSILKNTPFELAYRALNELLLAVVSAQPQDIKTLHAVWDDFLMCKVLPRIEGDQDKLGNNPSLLEQLSDLLKKTFGDDFWSKEQARPDLYREKITADDAADEDKIIFVACRSRIKLNWMQERLDKASFTSFWP